MEVLANIAADWAMVKDGFVWEQEEFTPEETGHQGNVACRERPTGAWVGAAKSSEDNLLAMSWLAI